MRAPEPNGRRDCSVFAGLLRRGAIVFAFLCAAAFGALCWSFPLPASGEGEAAKGVPSFLLFLGRLHPVILHLPIGLLIFGALLYALSWLPPGRSLRPALTLCVWLGAASAVGAATAGWLLAQEGGYKGPVFDLHWKFGLAIAGLSLLLLVLTHLEFRGAMVVQGAAWLVTLGCLGFGAHQGGSLSHGEDFLSEYAPGFLKPLLRSPEGGRPATAVVASGNENSQMTGTTAMFRQYCTDCHGPNKAKGDQRLHTPEDIAKGGKSGSSVVPGNPDKSLVLVRVLLPYDDKKHMPPEGKPQPKAEEINALRKWIVDGAPGLPGGGTLVAAAAGPANAASGAQSNPSTWRLGGKSQSASTSISDPPDTMNLRPVVAAATLLANAAAAPADSPADPNGLAGQVLKIFAARCVECHGKEAKEPEDLAFIDDLGKLRTSEYVNLTNPQASKIYLKVQTGDMPRRTKADKEAGKKVADPLTEEQVATILSWLDAGAPAGARSVSPVIVENTQPAPPVPAPAPKPEPSKATRQLVTPPEEITAALADLQTVPREDQADTRYVSLASASNNTKISDVQLENLRHGVRKLLNSLSTAPRVATFEEVGPGKVLFRVRLRDIGWDAALWDHVAAHFPLAIDTGVSAALGGACHATIPILRADWLAANAARPPLYHDILRLPKHQQELERDLGIDLVANLNAGEAVRSGLVKSGISLANRLVERHETSGRAGYYWASYDFRSSSNRGDLLKFPLGPEKAHLAGGEHAFKQAGGEIVFSLPNGFNGYYLADVLGNRLDGAAPTDIVFDRSGVTGRGEISNGLSCITCHDRGIKSIDGQDAIRPIASTFNAEEERLIERLHPLPEKFEAIWKADAERFEAAVNAAHADPVPGQPESVGALAALFDRDVSIETAAAEVGLSPDDLAHRLDDQAQLFSLRATLKNGGTLLRDHFLDEFANLVERLNLGQVRGGAQPIDVIPLPGRTKPLRPIPVELKTDKTIYTEGDDLVVFVQAAESGHLRLLYQNAAGEIYTLFPNQFITDDRIEGGRVIKIMPAPNPKKAGDEVAIQIAGPNFGTEYLAAIVTDQPFTDETALKQQLKTAQFAKSAARTIEDVITKDARVISRPAKDDAPGGARAGFARLTITTVRKQAQQ